MSRRQVDKPTRVRVDVSTVRTVDIAAQSGLIGVLRTVWHKTDGLAVAKAGTAFLVGVLIFAVLLAIGVVVLNAAWFG